MIPISSNRCAPIALGLSALLVAWTPAVPLTGVDLLAKSRAAYAGLKAYSDTGLVVTEAGNAGGMALDRFTFKTFYRAPRYFYFDITKQADSARFLIWSDADAFHTWWSVTGVEDEYPRGTGASAFVNSAGPSGGYVMYIAPLLFPQVGLAGTLNEIGETELAGSETIGGHACHKLTGVAKSAYTATGHEFAARKVSIWIDQQSLLVRKVFEDTPRGMGAGWISRVSVTFEPQANPSLDDAKFKFTVPSSPH
jgi:hypothetical protein